jgi:hypothetical protein
MSQRGGSVRSDVRFGARVLSPMVSARLPLTTKLDLCDTYPFELFASPLSDVVASLDLYGPL